MTGFRVLFSCIFFACYSQILIQDLFQNVAEEKEAQGITGKLHEAKSRKSFDSFEIISRLATPSSFGKIIDSVKEVSVNSPLNSAVFNGLQSFAVIPTLSIP